MFIGLGFSRKYGLHQTEPDYVISPFASDVLCWLLQFAYDSNLTTVACRFLHCAYGY